MPYSEEPQGQTYPMLIRCMVKVTMREGELIIDTNALKEQVKLELRRAGVEVKGSIKS